jgi:hypothetical protein
MGDIRSLIEEVRTILAYESEIVKEPIWGGPGGKRRAPTPVLERWSGGQVYTQVFGASCRPNVVKGGVRRVLDTVARPTDRWRALSAPEDWQETRLPSPAGSGSDCTGGHLALAGC